MVVVTGQEARTDGEEQRVGVRALAKWSGKGEGGRYQEGEREEANWKVRQVFRRKNRS